MHKPLWIFFNVLMDRGSQPLSVDQYFDFFTAFNEIKLDHIDSLESLRDFCKIFWLNNDSFENEFNDLFSIYTTDLELDKLFLGREEIKKNEDEKTDDSSEKPDKIKDEGISESSQRTESERPSSTKDKPIEEQENEAQADFELVVGDGKSKVRKTKRSYLSHQFKLDDQSIMPFKPRYLTQRIRRLVENPRIEWTDDIDYEVIIEEFSKKRFIEEIKYQKKETSHSHVVLLADHWGSMLAYEYLEKQISQSILSIPGCKFEHFTFMNLPEYNANTKGYKMYIKGGGEMETRNLRWDKDTWIFLLSDGGGLSGMVNRGRMRASFQLWRYLKSKTDHVYWINPVSKKHREGTTAQRLNLSIPMLFPIQSELNIFFNKA